MGVGSKNKECLVGCDRKKMTEALRSSKRSREVPVHHPPTCCSCLEEQVPYLVLVGCSNHHMICHVCARMLVSSKVVMQKFPLAFPGKVSHVGELDCPLCREPINGITNLFVTEGLDTSQTYECPYAELMEHDAEHQAFTLTELHRHIIRAHNQSVKCPNCWLWLGAEDNDAWSTDDKSLANLLQFHIMKQCQKVKCYGCDRTGNMIDMYLHSSVGTGHPRLLPVCESAKDLLRLFGESLAEATFLFPDGEDLTQLSSTLIRWTLQYFCQRVPSSASEGSPEALVQRLLWTFVPRMFCALHGEGTWPELLRLTSRTHHEASGAYEEWMLLRLSSFAQQRGLGLDHVSTLPLFYRLLVMALSDSDRVQQGLTVLSASEERVLQQWLQFYQHLIPGYGPVPPAGGDGASGTGGGGTRPAVRHSDLSQSGMNTM